MGAQNTKDLRPIVANNQNHSNSLQHLNQQLIHANPNINPNVTRIATISGLKHSNKQRQKFGANIFAEHNGMYGPQVGHNPMAVHLKTVLLSLR